MKKQLLSVIFILISIFCFSQKTELRDNPTFIDYLKKSKELSTLIGSALGNDTKRIAAAASMLQNLQNDNSLSDETIFIKIKAIFNLPATVDVKYYFNQISQDISVLQNLYKARFTEQYLKQEMEATASVLSNEGSGCEHPWAYGLCSGGCYSVAALAYTGCTGTTVGAPLCWALVAIGQTACIQECYRSWCTKQ
jgi:hypothetical protein